MLEPVIQLPFHLGHPAIDHREEFGAGIRPAQEITLAFDRFGSLLGAGQCARQGAGEEIAAHLKAGSESGLAVQQDDHDGSLCAQVNENGARRERAEGPVGIDQGIGRVGDFAQVFLVDPLPQETLAHVVLLAERHPELLPAAGGSLGAHKVIDNA